MRTIRKLIGLGLAIFFSAIAFAASTTAVFDERALREECSAFSEAGMRDCLTEKSKKSQKALSQAEEKVVDTLSKWDEDSKFLQLAKARLSASGKAFAKYRDEQCAFASSLGGGAIGNALEIRRLACVTELNNRRAAQLRDAVSDLPLK